MIKIPSAVFSAFSVSPSRRAGGESEGTKSSVEKAPREWILLSEDPVEPRRRFEPWDRLDESLMVLGELLRREAWLRLDPPMVDSARRDMLASCGGAQKCWDGFETMSTTK